MTPAQQEVFCIALAWLLVFAAGVFAAVAAAGRWVKRNAYYRTPRSRHEQAEEST